MILKNTLLERRNGRIALKISSKTAHFAIFVWSSNACVKLSVKGTYISKF